jgi:hypothetical protein
MDNSFTMNFMLDGERAVLRVPPGTPVYGSNWKAIKADELPRRALDPDNKFGLQIVTVGEAVAS